MQKDLEKQKRDLVERLGVHMEGEHNLPPLAARIYATLVLTGKQGITFEQLVQDLSASKSTICTHLNTLQVTDTITYFTKPGDRKRYFVIHPNRLHKMIAAMVDKWETQKNIQQDILNFKKSINMETPEEDENTFDLEFHENYLNFLHEASESIKKLQQKLSIKPS